MTAIWRSILLLSLTVTIIAPPCFGLSPLGLFKKLIQDNLSGKPENFRVVSWKFDPDIALRRSIEFQEKFGVHGEWLIARLGQGDDGYLDEGRLHQIIREQDVDPRHNENFEIR